VRQETSPGWSPAKRDGIRGNGPRKNFAPRRGGAMQERSRKQWRQEGKLALSRPKGTHYYPPCAMKSNVFYTPLLANCKLKSLDPWGQCSTALCSCRPSGAGCLLGRPYPGFRPALRDSIRGYSLVAPTALESSSIPVFSPLETDESFFCGSASRFLPHGKNNAVDEDFFSRSKALSSQRSAISQSGFLLADC
jgi:hypothetical protein